MRTRTKALLIRTPEGIVFPMEIAGPVTRFLAWIVDVAVLYLGISIVVSLTEVAIRSGWNSTGADIALGIRFLAYFVVVNGYRIALEWLWRGQTLGKRLLGLRVIDEQGLRLRFSQIVIRNLLRAVDALPGLYLLGGVSSLFSALGQRLGDIAANTVVIREPKLREPDLDQLIPDRYNSFRAHAHLSARLRQYVSPQEAGIALRALMLRETLEPAARLKLFTEIADHFRSVVRFPAEASEGISDERYVRNVVDILFRDAKGA